MKKLFGLLAFAVCCFVARGSDLPVPSELIGNQTLAIVNIDIKGLKYEQVMKSLAEKLGDAPDEKSMGDIKGFLEKFKAAGGSGVSILINAGKDTNAENGPDGIVIAVNKGEEGDIEKLTELLNAGAAPLKDKMAPDCPKKVGDSLVWHSAKFKLPKADADREKYFISAFSHLAKDSSISIVFVPDEEAVEVAEGKLKDAKPEEAKMMKALLHADGYCIFTDFGKAADPGLKVLILAADADAAGVLEKAASGMLAEVKKEAPPPVQAFLGTLQVVQAGANVQLSIGLSDLAKAAQAMMAAMMAPPPDAK